MFYNYIHTKPDGKIFYIGIHMGQFAILLVLEEIC